MGNNKQLVYLDDVRRAILHNNPSAAFCLSGLNPVDATEVVHGEWIEDYETFVDANGYESEPIQTGWCCSECGKDGGLPNWNYCPNCGTMMDGDKNE